MKRRVQKVELRRRSMNGEDPDARRRRVRQAIEELMQGEELEGMSAEERDEFFAELKHRIEERRYRGGGSSL
jgi:hypothetical protein